MSISDDYKTLYPHANYEKLYHAAVGYIADIHDSAARALEGLEELYLQQTGPIPAPEHLKLVGAGEKKEGVKGEQQEEL